MVADDYNQSGFHVDLFAETLGPLRDADRRPTLPAKTAQDLQWDAVVDKIAAHAGSPEGAIIARALGPLRSRTHAERRHREVAEYLALLDHGEDAPIYGLRDIRRAVAYAAREGVLLAEDLEAIGRNCDVATRVGRFFAARRERAPLLAGVAELLDDCAGLREALNHAIEPGGRIADSASPDLRRLRRAVQNHTDRIKSNVERLLRSEQFENLLQDDFFTLREDRYVLPVRVSVKNTVGGIVHGYSSSGQTAFIEPAELIELNNQLRWAQIEVEEEEKRILSRLSALVAANADALGRNAETTAYLDVTASAARFSRDIHGSIPQFSDDGSIQVSACKHPLLFLKLQPEFEELENPTVANDVIMTPEQRVLVVSGPNTGGKTVLLKAFGLAAVMARSGLPIAAAPGSTLPFVASVFTDIGDEQSIERDLSTFSGHLVNIRDFLPRCRPGSLVLLDELFNGTDPLQGAALAVALLEELAARDVTTVVTTHLEGLKTLALESEQFANAAMGFELESLEPTFRVTIGIPGSSFALRIADRLQFPGGLVQRAREVLEGTGRLGIDEAMARLEDQVASLHKEQERLEKARRAAESERDRLKRKYDRLLAQEREALHGETRELRSRLAEVRALARRRLKELKREEATRQELEAIRSEVEKAAAQVEAVREKTAPLPEAPEGLVRVNPADLEAGMTVYAPQFKRTGDVLDVSGEEALVQVGPMKVSVKARDLFFPSELAKTRHYVAGPEREPPASDGRNPGVPQTSDNTLDLRGMRVDEALERLELYLDAALLSGQEGVFIIHGHGTGALKRAVRGFLPDSHYVRDFRRGERGEGGDGVTVAFLSQ